LKTDVARRPLNVLLLEDRPTDAELIVHELKQAGFDPAWHRVENEAEYLAALEPTLDVILADVHMPRFDAPRALDLLRKRDLDVPFIVVSGSIDEETAVHALKSGAADYLLKDRLARLGQAVQRAIDERRLQREKREAERALGAAEERTRFALEASRVGTWEVDVTTGVVRWSETLEALHGLPAGSFAGTFEASFSHIHAEDRPLVVAMVEQAIREHENFNILYRTQWPDGSIHWIRAIGRTFYDEDGTPLRAAGIGLDVTEHRTLEDQYRQAQKMEAIGQLAGGVAHDFNNILTAIEGYCTLITEELPADSPVQADLLEIHRAAERATSLTRQLLAFSRRQILDPRVLDLRDSLKTMAPMLKRLIGEDIEVVVRSPDDIGRVKADPGQIEQVVLNLALNARDAMPRGGTLLLEVAEVLLDESYARHHAPTKPGRYVMLAVNDTGAGMDATTQARVFEPFFTTKENGQGTGLGLATVYGIVKQSGGYIWLYSELGRGSTFKVYLPRIEDAAEMPVAQPAPGSLRGSETILVVEDEDSVRELVRRALERCGYRVLIAPTPNQALEIASVETETIHLLLSDVILPQMSGSTLASQIVPDHPGMRVLYMSGYTDSAIVHHGVLSQGTPFLQKPFTAEALARKVRDVLG
jgi:two-component system cell cycle sensor histidine kinase/response regulator CckA